MSLDVLYFICNHELWIISFIASWNPYRYLQIVTFVINIYTFNDWYLEFMYGLQSNRVEVEFINFAQLQHKIFKFLFYVAKICTLGATSLQFVTKVLNFIH